MPPSTPTERAIALLLFRCADVVDATVTRVLAWTERNRDLDLIVAEFAFRGGRLAQRLEEAAVRLANVET